MAKYLADNTFSFQLQVHQINSLRQKHAIGRIINIINTGRHAYADMIGSKN